jgi:HK97 family phage major capsid protein
MSWKGTSAKQLIEKADLALSSLTTANGALLSPEQSDTFFRHIIEQSPLLSQVRTVPMTSPIKEIAKIGMGGQVLRPADGAYAEPIGSAAYRSAPTFDKVTLIAKKFMAEVRIPYDVLEDNIEGQSMSDTVMSMLMQAVSRDLSQLVLIGDSTGGATNLLKSMDGILKKVTTNVINGSTLTFGKSNFAGMWDTLADAYKSDPPALRFWTSFQRDTALRLGLSDRETTGGDAWLTGRVPLQFFGVPTEPMNFMPNAPSTLGNVLLIDPRNIIVGFHRNVTVETDRNIEDQFHMIVVSMRVDIAIEEEQAAVKAYSVPAFSPAYLP